AAQERLRSIDSVERNLVKREAAVKRGEAALTKGERASEAMAAKLEERADAIEVAEHDLRSRRAAIEQEANVNRPELERREHDLAAKERALATESDSLEALRSTLEEQEPAVSPDLRETETAKAAS